MIERFEHNGVTILICEIEKNADSRRENERQAVRKLVETAFGKEAKVGHNQNGVPYIIGSDVSISISHSLDYAAIAYSYDKIVGIDIEQPREQLRRVAPRILSEQELAVYGQSDDLLLRAWTLKEALYKAALTPGLDFIKQIKLPLDSNGGKAAVNGADFEVSMVFSYKGNLVSMVCRR